MAFDREKTLQAAQKYVDKRKYDRAIAEYQKVVEHEPNDARTLLRIGDLQARLGAHVEAIATYDRVALYYATRGFSLKAVAVLKQINELIDRHAPHLLDQYSHVAPKLAQIYADLGLTNDALATYDAVARRLQNRGRDRDAVDIIRHMVALERSNPLPYLRLAEALCRVSRVDEAVEQFWSAAQLLSQQSRQDDALKVLERILHFRQDARVARVAAELYLAKATRDAGLSALSRLQLCFEADPRDLETLVLLARAFDVIGQPSKGVEVYKEMVRIAGETGQADLHHRYLQHLLAVAPRDEEVRALAALHGVQSERPGAKLSSIPPESLSEDDLEFIDDEPSIRASEPRSAPPPRDDPGAAEARSRALADAEGFRARRLYSRAVATLRHALVLAPQSIELRAALQQVLLEMGDTPGAVEQMLAVARQYMGRGSLSAAEAELYQVLELVPDQPGALDLLAQIEVLDRERRRAPGRGGRDDAGLGEHEAFELVSRPPSPPPRVPPPPEPGDAPLPAYELEDDDLVALTPSELPPAGDGELGDEAPLPQFSLDSGLHTTPPPPERAAEAPPSAPAEATSLTPAQRDSVRAALDEAQFFTARGLYQDACLILRDRLEQYPGVPELVEALEAIEPRLSSESGTRDVGRLSEAAPGRAPERGFEDEEPTIASPQQPGAEREGRIAQRGVSHELVVQFSTDGGTQRGGTIDADADLDLVNALEEPAQTQVDVDEVFAKFKQGVKAQVSDSDSATHYDLGVAYKEMGLLADAAREFEIASRDPKRECNCLAMMGMMYRERGELDRAAEAYVRGLSAKHKTVAQEVSLYYDLGAIYELKNDPDEAIYYYQRITRRDPSYRDVSERLAALLPRSRRSSQPARAINDDQDFDRSFDDLYKRD